MENGWPSALGMKAVARVLAFAILCFACSQIGVAWAKPIVPLKLAYAGDLGGNTGDQPFSIAADTAGSVYVAGSTGSANFPIVDALQPKLKGATDAFVAKISADGTALIYATYLGGSGLDVATGIALDAAGNA